MSKQTRNRLRDWEKGPMVARWQGAEGWAKGEGDSLDKLPVIK